MNVIYQQKEKTQGKIIEEASNAQLKVGHLDERKDNGQFSPWGLMTKKQGQLLNIKKWTKGKSRDNSLPIG